MKKLLSVIMALTMLLSITAGIDFSAYASVYYETEPNYGYSPYGYVTNDIRVNDTIYGSIENMDDEDWFEFTLTSPRKITIKFSHDVTNYGSWNICLERLDPPSTYDLLEYTDVYADDSGYTFTTHNLSAGTYYIGIDGRDYYGYPHGLDYWISLEEYINKPTNFRMTSNSTSGFNLAWNAVGGVNGYNVQCYYGGKWNTLKRLSSGTNYCSFTNLKPGTNYKMRIAAYKIIDGKYYWSACSYLNASTKKVYSPSSLKVSTRNQTSLKLSWSRVSGASGYNLQRYSGGSWKNVVYTTGSSYTVKSLGAGNTYKFRVRAYKKVGGKYYYSGYRYLTACTKPKTVSFSSLTAYKSGHKIKAAWKKVGGSASGYQIYWARDSKFKKIAAKTTVSGRSKTSYTGKNFTKGKRYYVKVRAYKTVDGKKYYGSWSKVKSIKAK